MTVRKQIMWLKKVLKDPGYQIKHSTSYQRNLKRSKIFQQFLWRHQSLRVMRSLRVNQKVPATTSSSIRNPSRLDIHWLMRCKEKHHICATNNLRINIQKLKIQKQRYGCAHLLSYQMFIFADASTHTSKSDTGRSQVQTAWYLRVFSNHLLMWFRVASVLRYLIYWCLFNVACASLLL
jgi:hypothetical protein